MFDGVDVFKTKPQHVNEKGVKFWLDKDLTRYAVGKGLKDIVVLLTEHPDGSRTRLVAENQQPLYDNPSYEAVACYIDILKVARTEESEGGPCGPTNTPPVPPTSG